VTGCTRRVSSLAQRRPLQVENDSSKLGGMLEISILSNIRRVGRKDIGGWPLLEKKLSSES